jgi:hypothetical protein
MNTIGMFYADEIVYIFESPAAELIRIPRLPIQINPLEWITNRTQTQVAMMAAGHLYGPEAVGEIPAEMLERASIDGRDYVGLSAWGQLIWQRSKMAILTQEEPLELPRLMYSESFRADVKAERERKTRLQLHETLVKVAHLLEEGQGDTGKLKADHGLKYEKYNERPGIDKFRVNDERRIMCTAGPDGLTLHRYGHKNRVY